MLYALKHVLRLKQSGLAWFGVPCSLLVFSSLGTSKRGIWPFDLFGDTAIPCVRRSNVHLARTALLVLVCIVRQVWWAVEQPGTSRLPQIQYFASILEDPALPTEFSRLPESY